MLSERVEEEKRYESDFKDKESGKKGNRMNWEASVEGKTCGSGKEVEAGKKK